MGKKSKLTVTADSSNGHPYIINFWSPDRKKLVAVNAGGHVEAGPTTVSSGNDIEGILFLGEEGIAKQEFYYFHCSNHSGDPTVSVAFGDDRKKGIVGLSENEHRVYNFGNFHVDFRRKHDTSNKEFEMHLQYTA